MAGASLAVPLFLYTTDQTANASNSGHEEYTTNKDNDANDDETPSTSVENSDNSLNATDDSIEKERPKGKATKNSDQRPTELDNTSSSNDSGPDEKRKELEEKYNKLLQRKNKYKESGVDYSEEEFEKIFFRDLNASLLCSSFTCKKAWLDEVIATLRVEELEKFLKEIESLSEEYPERKNDLESIAIEMQSLLSDYSDEATEAKKIRMEEEEKKAAEIARYNSVGKVVPPSPGANSYFKASSCPQMNYTYYGSVVYDGMGMVICQCTSYASWKVYERYGRSAVGFGISGNAKDWGRTAAASGLLVDDKPAAWTVGYQTSGTYGHVVWIEGVNADGTVNVSEYNNLYSSVSGKKGDFGYRTNVPANSFRYIHFK